MPVQAQRRFVPAYTIGLFVVGFLALITVFSHQMLITLMQQQGIDAVVTTVLRLCQAFEAILFLTAITVAALRAKDSILALPTTAALSILLALWVPIGTAVFVWWLVSIRKQEKPALP